ncbi:hypothetical protein [Ferruginibacter sp. SUN106]|uniref:hypothetical protein n=1 Tax=Ferruginibacter sp. SUN106 TaxID=2978348 RepID=UPI003D368EB5
MKEKIIDLSKQFADNVNSVSAFFENNGKEFESLYDSQTELFNNHFPFVQDPYYVLKSHEQIVLQTFYKAHNLIYTSYRLLLEGNYGASNMLIRGITEYLLIGKYFSVKKDLLLADKWLNGTQFDTYEKAIKYLIPSQKQIFHKFWCLCCNDNHAMAHSFQVGFDIENSKIALGETFARLTILQICSYHLLGGHLLNGRLKYRSELWGAHKERNSQLKSLITGNISNLKSALTKQGIELAKTYKSKWVFQK